MDKTQTGAALLRFMSGGVITPEETRSIFYEFLQTLEELATLRQQLADCKEVLADQQRLTREIEVIMNGEEGAARQPSLCDVVAQLRRDWPDNQLNAARYLHLRDELIDAAMQKDQSNET